MGIAALENVTAPQKIKIELPYEPVISLLGIYPQYWKQDLGETFVHISHNKRWRQPTIDSMSVSLKNLFVDALIPIVMLFGGGASGK